MMLQNNLNDDSLFIASMALVSISRYSLGDVLRGDRILYNVNNLYEQQPSDYWTNRFYTEDWIGLFHDDYHTMILPESELTWMKKAKRVSQIRFKFPSVFRDELEESCRRHREEFDRICQSDALRRGWFIRTENYSFKYAVHGAGPYYALEDIFESLTTYVRGHEGIFDADTSKKLYFLPWLEIDRRKEFRIFVFENSITAMSVQHLYETNDWLSGKGDQEIAQLVDKILNHFVGHIREKLTFMGSYVMDLALIGPDETPYFIEPNAYGAQYGAGSALFHWINDDSVLRDSSVIDFRFVDRE
jgi:hypothetical protein